MTTADMLAGLPPDLDARTLVAAILTGGILTTVKTLTWTADEGGPVFGVLPKALAAAAATSPASADLLLARLARPTPTGGT